MTKEKEEEKEVETEKEVEEKEEEKGGEKEEESSKHAQGQKISLITPHVTTKEHVVVKTLDSLPHATPSVSLARPRKDTFLYMSSIRSQGGVEDSQEDINLDEVITISRFDL